EKILYNLLGNALKYTPENGTISLMGNRVGKNFEIAVVNSGNYITPKDQQKIFERFYQTNSKNPGSGIGLSLSRELAEIHKGKISVESHENGITKFKVTLPVTKNTFEKNTIFPENAQPAPLQTNPLVEIDVEKEIVLAEDAPVVLIIDDSSDIREYVSSIFESTYTVYTANNGKE